MGSNKEKSTGCTILTNDKEQIRSYTTQKEVEKILKVTIACLVSFLVSLGGGLILAWWQFEYHPDNRQLWMVPFGLILLTTPVIVWVSLVFSDICGLHNITNDNISGAAQPLPPLGDSSRDPEK